MKVVVTNKTEYQQFVDTVGLNNPDDVIAVPAKGKITIELPNEKRFIDVSKANMQKLMFKKL